MLKRWREEFIYQFAKGSAGHELETALKLLRYAATLQRLAEAQCNGDWPADNGERKTVECPRCACYWHPSVIKRAGCPDCRTQDKVNALCVEANLVPEYQGDPRGCLIKIKMSDGRELGVPS